MSAPNSTSSSESDRACSTVAASVPLSGSWNFPVGSLVWVCDKEEKLKGTIVPSPESAGGSKLRVAVEVDKKYHYEVPEENLEMIEKSATQGDDLVRTRSKKRVRKHANVEMDRLLAIQIQSFKSSCNSIRAYSSVRGCRSMRRRLLSSPSSPRSPSNYSGCYPDGFSSLCERNFTEDERDREMFERVKTGAYLHLIAHPYDYCCEKYNRRDYRCHQAAGWLAEVTTDGKSSKKISQVWGHHSRESCDSSSKHPEQMILYDAAKYLMSDAYIQDKKRINGTLRLEIVMLECFICSSCCCAIRQFAHIFRVPVWAMWVSVKKKHSNNPVFTHYHIRDVVKKNIRTKKSGTRELGVLWALINDRDPFSSANQRQKAKFLVTEDRSCCLMDGCDLECDDRCHKFLDLMPFAKDHHHGL